MFKKKASFSTRKQEHIRLSLSQENQAFCSQSESIELIHEALPELDFNDISIKQKVFGKNRKTPFLVSSMTAGHSKSVGLNICLAEACNERGWFLGVGSQRRELTEPDFSKEWQRLRKKIPQVSLLGNLGLSQVIHTPLDDIRRLVDSLEAEAFIVHTNPLQECFQPEGTPQFKGGLRALEKLCAELPIPVILKETGCGFSEQTFLKLKNIGLYAVDVSGFGGTHWGRIEGHRARVHSRNPIKAQASQTFKNWGISTLDSLKNAYTAQFDKNLWASGGVRSGLQSAVFLSMGCEVVGFAQPILEAALKSQKELIQKMETIEFELKTALFCTGCADLKAFQEKKPWRSRTKLMD